MFVLRRGFPARLLSPIPWYTRNSKLNFAVWHDLMLGGSLLRAMFDRRPMTECRSGGGYEWRLFGCERDCGRQDLNCSTCSPAMKGVEAHVTEMAASQKDNLADPLVAATPPRTERRRAW